MKKEIIIISVLFLFMLNCTPLPNTCNTNTSDFQQLYNTTLLSNSNYIEMIHMDTEIHAYSFTVNTQKEICSIGYQSIPAMLAAPYRIVIMDSVNNITLYNKSSIFSSTNISYVNPIIPVILNPGTVYTINRIQENHGNNISNTIGKLLYAGTNSVFPFPIIYNDLTIINANFMDVGMPPNVAPGPFLPYIDIVFKTP